MKRFACMLLTIILIPVMVCADFSGLSDDELKAQFYATLEELITRGIWANDTIPAGFYIVGQSIPAGSYELTPIKHDTIEIFPDMEHLTENKGRTMYLIFDEGETFIITLVDGMTVDLGTMCKIKPLDFKW